MLVAAKANVPVTEAGRLPGWWYLRVLAALEAENGARQDVERREKAKQARQGGRRRWGRKR